MEAEQAEEIFEDLGNDRVRIRNVSDIVSFDFVVKWGEPHSFDCLGMTFTVSTRI
jgi:hypothetical protein